jgi:hypothetical protein
MGAGSSRNHAFAGDGFCTQFTASRAVDAMSERHFPDDHEVDKWLSRQAVDATDANPIIDQLQAATADSLNRFRTNAPALVAAGVATRYIEVPDPDRSKIRRAIRQMMAALSVGVFHLCPHTQQIRPLVLMCDPPAIVCATCLPSRKAAIETLGHRWNHQCGSSEFRVGEPSGGQDHP